MDALVSGLTFVGIYGLSYGMILFLISVGLVMTMGLVRVVNMAHGVFAAFGGYIAVALMNSAGLPYALAIVLACAVAGLGSLVVERLFFRRLYGASELEQALLTIGLAFIGIASLNLLFGANVVSATLPAPLTANIDLLGRSVQVYRVFVIVLGFAVVLSLWYAIDRTTFGARLRACVDNAGMAEAVGINVRRLFAISYAAGSCLAALGGAVGAAILPLEPIYPFKYLVLILMVVVMSGKGQMMLAAAVSIFLGVVDTAGRFLYPETGSFLIYMVLLVYLIVRGNTLIHSPVVR